MANALKRIATLEKALEQLLARDKVYLLVRAGDTPEAAEQRAIADGRLDPTRQEAFFIFSKIPGIARQMQPKPFDIPAATKSTIAQELAHELSLPKPPPDNPHPPKRDDGGAALRQQMRIEAAYRLMAKGVA
jgi:hypothetical protein